ncbi:putative membrane protein (plasmid) [Staphylococcus epidermidis]|nr:putative membrane protein [Staphylococcus epidermidis]
MGLLRVQRLNVNKAIGIKQFYLLFYFLLFINLNSKATIAIIITKINMLTLIVVLICPLVTNIELMIIVKEMMINRIVKKLYSLFIFYLNLFYIFIIYDCIINRII